MAPDERPFPPGEYPVLVIGSGPGGLQLSYGLRRYGVEHAVISADPSPGGMFRRWPFFQRLLSWTKPYAPAELRRRASTSATTGTACSPSSPSSARSRPSFLDGTSYFPSRPEMQANLAAFADRAGHRRPLRRRWERTRREEGPDGPVFVVETTDGEYRCRDARARRRHRPAVEPEARRASSSRATTRRPATRRPTPASGCSSSASRTPASSSRRASRRGRRRSRSRRRRRPRPASQTKSLVGVRARYVQPFEDNFLGLGVSILDASIDSIEPSATAIRVDLRRTDNGEPMCVEADEVIAATGFTCPLQDLPDLGVTTFGQARLPAVTPFWESATVPGHLLRRHDQPGRAGPPEARRPGQLGGRPRAPLQRLILARHIAETRFGGPGGAAGRRRRRPACPTCCARRPAPPSCGTRRPTSPAWSRSRPRTGIRDEGILPLAHVLDGMTRGPGGDDGRVRRDRAACTRSSTSGARRLSEHALPDPLLDFATMATPGPAGRRRGLLGR